MEEEKETEREELGEAPKEEIRVWGLGLTNNKLDKIIKKLEDLINLGRHTENKIEALLDEKAQERLEAIKRKRGF